MKVEIGSIWTNKQNGLPAKVVDRTLTPYFQPVQLTVIYDSLDGQGFQPGILPSTWFEEHWEENFRKPDPGEVGYEEPGVPDGAVAEETLMNHTSVRALYYVSANNSDARQDGPSYSFTHFNACYGQKGEKALFFNASPSGKAKLWVEPDVFPFPAGQHCWFDFTEAEEGAVAGEVEYLLMPRSITERFGEATGAKIQEEVMLSNQSLWGPGRCEFEVTIANPGAWEFFRPGRLYRLKITKAEV